MPSYKHEFAKKYLTPADLPPDGRSVVTAIVDLRRDKEWQGRSEGDVWVAVLSRPFKPMRIRPKDADALFNRFGTDEMDEWRGPVYVYASREKDNKSGEMVLRPRFGTDVPQQQAAAPATGMTPAAVARVKAALKHRDMTLDGMLAELHDVNHDVWERVTGRPLDEWEHPELLVAMKQVFDSIPVKQADDSAGAAGG